MGYQTPVTIVQMLGGLRDRQFVLPDIQREFVWSEDQIAELFDSLMRGYPIGTFLFWKLDAAAAVGPEFYEFITDYSELTPHNPRVNDPASPVTAVLDGQQRLRAVEYRTARKLCNSRPIRTEERPRLLSSPTPSPQRA